MKREVVCVQHGWGKRHNLNQGQSCQVQFESFPESLFLSNQSYLFVVELFSLIISIATIIAFVLLIIASHLLNFWLQIHYYLNLLEFLFEPITRKDIAYKYYYYSCNQKGCVGNKQILWGEKLEAEIQQRRDETEAVQ